MAKDSWSNETLTTKMIGLCRSVSKLKPMVYSAAALFSVLVVIGLGLRADIQYANARVDSVREMHIKEFRDMEQTIKIEIDNLEANMNEAFYDIGKDLGRNEASHIEIASKLNRIEEKLDSIAEWQREHK
jgi:hypothetical protein